MKVSSRLTGIAILAGVIILGFAAANLPGRRIAAASIPIVRADGGCSLASLRGPYAVSRQGTLVTSVLNLPAPAPYGEVARANFDGIGAFSGSATVNIGGIPINASFAGTYTVNSDCTGTITVHPNVPVVITEAIVVIGGGQQYVGTDTESFAVVQTNAQRL